jgi:hypothetical protein
MAYSFPNGPSVRVSDVFFRTAAGLFGGLFGSIVILIGIFLSGTISDFEIVSGVDGVNPIFIFSTLVVVYLSILISSVATTVLFHFTNREKYRFLFSTLSHVFVLTTLIFLAGMPLAIIVALSSLQNVAMIGVIELGLSAIFGIVLIEVFAQSRHITLALYSSSFALFTFFIISFLLYLVFNRTTSFLVLGIFPLCWACFGFWQSTFEMIYQWVYRLYGTDFLNAATKLGADYGQDEEEEEEDDDDDE